LENIENIQLAKNRKEKVIKDTELRRKLLISMPITIATAIIFFVCVLLINGQITTEGLITIVVVCIFGLIFSISLSDRWIK